MGTLSKHRLDKIWIGVVIGLAGALLGFMLFGIIWSIGTDHPFTYYLHDTFYGITSMFQDKIVTISILVDVVLFYIFLRLQWYNLCKGLLAVVILSVPVALCLY
ncbi:MAG: hypothetical protein ACK5XV_09930 [Flavobacteriales bacterium]